VINVASIGFTIVCGVIPFSRLKLPVSPRRCVLVDRAFHRISNPIRVQDRLARELRAARPIV
jgi:hypothetical protein